MSHRQVFSEQLPSALLRWLAGDLNFTIISNNCWGAHIYQALEIPYRTPFVGMFIPPKSYLHLIKRLDVCIRSDLVFVNESASATINLRRQRQGLEYPIGLLEGHVELHFLHYADETDARSRWQRRCRRIAEDPSRWFFKFDDSEGATAQDIEEFRTSSFGNKVCFTAARYSSSTVIIPAEDGAAHVVDGVALAKISRRYFNALRWISTLPPSVSLPSFL